MGGRSRLLPCVRYGVRDDWIDGSGSCDASTGKYSNKVVFGETTGRRSHTMSDARSGAQFVTEGDWDVSSTRELLPQRIASLANCHIEIGFGRRHGDGSCATGGLNSQMGIFDDLSQVKTICIYFVKGQLVLEFRDQIVRQDYSSMCVKGSYGPCKCTRCQIE